jgi:hypothetical protein
VAAEGERLLFGKLQSLSLLLAVPPLSFKVTLPTLPLAAPPVVPFVISIKKIPRRGL